MKNDIISATDLINEGVTSIDWLWEGFIKRGSISILAGTSDIGKSSLARDLALYVATGCSEFLDKKINSKQQRVLYVSTEDDQDMMAYLIKKQRDGLILSQNPDNLFFKFFSSTLVKDLKKEVGLNKYDLVIVDSMADLYSGNINDLSKAREFVNNFKQLAQNHQCSFLILHHTSKGKEKMEANKNNLLGSQSIEANARLVLELRKGHDPGTRELWVTKGNYVSDDDKKTGMLLDFDQNQNFSLLSLKSSLIRVHDSGKFSEKEKIIDRLIELKNEKKSFEKARNILMSEFDKVPSKGTLQSWYNKRKEPLPMTG